MWVERHKGVVGNEAAEAKAKKEVWMGEWMNWPHIITPAGIR